MPNWINSLVVMDRFCPFPLKRREWKKRILQVQSGCGRLRRGIYSCFVLYVLSVWMKNRTYQYCAKQGLSFSHCHCFFFFFSFLCLLLSNFCLCFSSIQYQGPPNTIISFRGTTLFKSEGYMFLCIQTFLLCVWKVVTMTLSSEFNNWLLFVLKPKCIQLKLLSEEC